MYEIAKFELHKIFATKNKHQKFHDEKHWWGGGGENGQWSIYVMQHCM